MKTLLHIKIAIIFFLFSDFYLAAQNKNNVVEISNDQTGNQVTNVACKEVRLKSGYRFAAESGKSMRTYIEPYMTCDVDYTPGFSSTPPPAPNTSSEAGTTPGSFAVTQTGAATYNIPLTVPPGTAGMIPSISVTYNSQGGEGLLGMGWNLSGLSAITRTGKTLYHDDEVTPVNINSEDKFALDGNRLLLVVGNYGESGTRYETEIKTFSRITSYSIAGDGPAWFNVETKDGSELEYGRSADACIEASGGSKTALTWLLNKITDVRGNYIKIHYIENINNGSFYPDYIEYTGNTTSGLTPYNVVKFVYGARQDKREYWIAGHNIQQNVLLTAVEMYAEGKLMLKYEFNYSYDIGSHLSEIIEKGKDGKQYNSIKIVWNTNNIVPNIKEVMKRT